MTKKNEPFPEQYQFDLITSDKSRNIAHLGVGTGKTFLMGYISALFVCNCKNSLGFIGSNTYGQLSDSTLLRVFDVYEKCFNWVEGRDYVIGIEPPESFIKHNHTFINNKNKIFYRNGHVQKVASLDNYKAIDGLEVGYALLDETKDTKEAAVKDTIITRLRQKSICTINEELDSDFKFIDSESVYSSGNFINPLFIFTSPSREQWLSEMFKFEDYRKEILQVIGSKDEYFKVSEGNKTIVIGSTYLNPHNPKSYVNDMISDMSEDRVALNIYGSPFGKSGAEYYSSYKRETHVKECKLDEISAVHLGFDFNSHPYMTGLVCQIVKGEDERLKVRFLKGYPMKAPNNNIESVCREFKKDFGEHALNYGFYYYGDASGKNTLPIEDYKNYFEIIKIQLYDLINHDSRRLLRQNPRHKTIRIGTVGRRDFLNKCFRGGYGFDIEIDPSCKELISDLEYIKEDKTGAKLKEKAKIEGVLCEKYGHFSDALDSILTYVFGDWSKE